MNVPFAIMIAVILGSSIAHAGPAAETADAPAGSIHIEAVGSHDPDERSGLTTGVPEPVSLAMLALGPIALVAAHRITRRGDDA